MLMGPSGTGKTTSLKTLIDCGITPYVIFTEPGMEVLGDLPLDKVHWHHVKAADQSWAELIDFANKVNQFTFEALTKIGGVNKAGHQQIQDILKACNRFVCDRTGEDFGDVSTWNTDRCLVVDSLTGLSSMAMGLVVGNKPVRSLPDWGVAQNALEFILGKLNSLHCSFVLIAHIERETDEVLGGIKLMPSTLGRKLAPKIPLPMSDVILTVRNGTTWTWSTANPQADLKTRNLAIAENLPPSFKPLIESWKKHGGLVCPTKQGSTPNP